MDQANISLVQKAKKYRIIFDIGPYNVHIEHISQIFRFVEILRACLEILVVVTDFIQIDVNTLEVIKMEIIFKRKKILQK